MHYESEATTRWVLDDDRRPWLRAGKILDDGHFRARPCADQGSARTTRKKGTHDGVGARVYAAWQHAATPTALYQQTLLAARRQALAEHAKLSDATHQLYKAEDTIEQTIQAFFEYLETQYLEIHPPKGT